MPPLPALLHSLLRFAALRLALLLGGVLVLRERRLRARLAALPVGHRRRAGMLRELAKLIQVRDALPDPAFFADARTLGKAAEVARCVSDAGRRALARRFGLLMWRNRGARRIARRTALAAASVLAGRCRGFPAVAC